MINRLVTFCLHHRLAVLIASAAVALIGILALWSTPVDGIPDLSDNQVIVYTMWDGQSPKTIDDLVATPLVHELRGLPRVKAVRSTSMPGASMVYVIFEDGVNVQWARTRVIERLVQASAQLPEGVSPVLGPDGTGVGHVLWYVLKSERYDLGQLRALQDWYLRGPLSAVQGVAEVASVGGFEKQYQVDLDPVKLLQHRVPATAVFQALAMSGKDVGGGIMERNGSEFQVHGRGYLRGREEIESVVIATTATGTPILVRDVGAVQIGGAGRRGILDENGDREVVGGIVVMRSGANPKEVIAGVKSKLRELEQGLPQGVTLEIAYDRSDLIDRAIGTLSSALIEEVILVSLAHVIFLWHYRSILVVTIPLPLSILVAFILMRATGIESNIMSLGGIAIAIGVLVDAGIVITENVIRSVETRGDGYELEIVSITEAATKKIVRPIAYSMAILILAFIPVFALRGIEGKMFHPLAYTKTFALIGAALVAITLVPVLCTFLVKGKVHGEAGNTVMGALRRVYEPTLNWALDHPTATLSGAAILFVMAILLLPHIGREFMPSLNEGTLLYMPVTSPSISATEAKRLLTAQDKVIKDTPEVASVLGKAGRADTATDPSPLSMFETLIALKPADQWRKGMTQDGLVAELNSRLRTPGVANGWTMPIINRINMLTTGVRTDVGFKIYGDDPEELARLSRAAVSVLQGIPGAVDVAFESQQYSNYIDIKVDRVSAARYGISEQVINDAVAIAYGGKKATETVEGRERYPVRVRLLADYRNSLDTIRKLPIGPANAMNIYSSSSSAQMGEGGIQSQAGAPFASDQVLLGQVAEVSYARGPAMINTENSRLRATVLLNVRGRDVGSFLEEARERIQRDLHLPDGYYAEWAGQYENQQRVTRTLVFVLPTVLAVILSLLVILYRSLKEALHVLLAVPFALTGGVFCVYLMHYNLSVAVWIGFISLFGTAVQTAMIMVVYLQEALQRVQERDGCLNAENLREAVIAGALLRLRPKVMTVSTVIAALVPLFLTSRTGMEVMRPIAAPVLGGMISSLLHVLVVTPVLFYGLRLRELKKAEMWIDVSQEVVG